MNHKERATALFQRGVEAVQPENLHYDLKGLDKEGITLLGSGKAVTGMAKALLAQGVNVKKSFLVSHVQEVVSGLEIFVSTHPVPSEKSVYAAETLMKIVSHLEAEESFVYLLSGGSSALIEKPIVPVTLEDMRTLTTMLLQSGASIGELNTVRKQLSMIKGGRLGASTKAKGKVFVISDVVGDDLEAIGSAPLYCDSSSCEDAKKVLVQCGLWERVAESVRSVIASSLHETPKTPNPAIVHEVVASNRIALEAVVREARRMGYEAEIVTDRMQGDVRDVAAEIARYADLPVKEKPRCFVFGGETTVQVRGDGKGGRNQELALWVLEAIREKGYCTFLSAGTDGKDGVGDAAGAVVESGDLHEDMKRYLQNNDSYHYHRKYGTLLRTGASGTNVMDIMILIKE